MVQGRAEGGLALGCYQLAGWSSEVAFQHVVSVWQQTLVLPFLPTVAVSFCALMRKNPLFLLGNYGLTLQFWQPLLVSLHFLFTPSGLHTFPLPEVASLRHLQLVISAAPAGILQTDQLGQGSQVSLSTEDLGFNTARPPLPALFWTSQTISL